MKIANISGYLIFTKGELCENKNLTASAKNIS